MCDATVDDSLAALKLIPNWCVTSKMIERLYTALYRYDNLLFFDEDSGDVKFVPMKWIFLVSIFIILFFFSDVLAWHIKFEKRQGHKILPSNIFNVYNLRILEHFDA